MRKDGTRAGFDRNLNQEFVLVFCDKLAYVLGLLRERSQVGLLQHGGIHLGK